MKNELFEKAKECKSAEELLALAKESGINMTAEEAAEKYAQLNNEGELSDDELKSAAGGGCSSSSGIEVGTRFKLEGASRCPACGHEYATIIEKDKRPTERGAITLYKFECESCKNAFLMSCWYGTATN